MTETLKGMGSMPKDAKKTAKPGETERAAVRELVKAARARGDDLTGRAAEDDHGHGAAGRAGGGDDRAPGP